LRCENFIQCTVYSEQVYPPLRSLTSPSLNIFSRLHYAVFIHIHVIHSLSYDCCNGGTWTFTKVLTIYHS
jgi:hypothetical protein